MGNLSIDTDGCFPDGVSPPDPGVLAQTTTGRLNVCGILHGVPRQEISMPPAGTHVTCSGGPPLGESGDGFVGHVNYIREGESLCAGDGGLLLSVDGVANSFHQSITLRMIWSSLSLM